MSRTKCSIHVLCVDHGLRPEATEEARAVAQQAARLDLTADILVWTGSKPKAGLQAAARAARYGLMLDHIRRVAANSGCSALVTAHHRDDLAETFLMRLARGAGVDGLSAIQPLIVRDGIAILRPFIEIPKERLPAFHDKVIEWACEGGLQHKKAGNIPVAASTLAEHEVFVKPAAASGG